MALTNAQLVTLKADILADPTFSAMPNGPDEAFTIAAAYNSTAVPDYYVWKQSVSESEILNNGMNFAEVDGLSPGKRDEWSFWIFRYGSCNPSKPNIRAGLMDIWSGTAAKNSVQLQVWGHCQKLATRGEKLFATGTGATAIVGGTGPSTTTLEQPISYQDVQTARNLP